MTDHTATMARLKKLHPSFSDARGWHKDQTPKDLAMALTVEAAELARLFMWLHSDEADSVRENAEEI